MPALGRSRWLCGDRACSTQLATVRGEHPHRRLRIDPAVMEIVYREDARVELRCPKCKRLNRFQWQTPRVKT